MLIRTFDPADDKHPVGWLLANAKSETYEAIHTWLESVLGETIPQPPSVVMPDQGLQT